MSRARTPLLLGLTAAGGIGYYLYGAGGSPKVAEKNFEADVHKASAKVKGELPGRGQQAEKEAEALGQKAGAKLDSVYAKSKDEFARAKTEVDAASSNTASYVKDTKTAAMKKVDELDKKIEEGASQAKSNVSSWFGGK